MFQMASATDLVQATPQLLAPPTVEVSGDIADGSTYEFDLEWSADQTAYAVTRLEVKSKEGRSITGATLREFPLGAMQTDALELAAVGAVKTDDGISWDAVRAAISDRIAEGRPKPTPDVLDLVGLAYEFALVRSVPPIKEIERLFMLPPSTAMHWVKLARERGHLDVPAAK